MGYPVLSSPLQRRATYFLIYDATQSNPWQRYPQALSRVHQATGGSSPFLVPERPPHTAPSNQPLPQSSKAPHSPTQQLRHGPCKATDCQTLGPTPPSSTGPELTAVPLMAVSTTQYVSPTNSPVSNHSTSAFPKCYTTLRPSRLDSWSVKGQGLVPPHPTPALLSTIIFKVPLTHTHHLRQVPEKTAPVSRAGAGKGTELRCKA